MAKTLTQNVLFKGTKASELYNLYMDAKKHADVTGAPAVISNKEGTTYKVHGGYINGKNLKLVKGKMILQTWRAQGWKKGDLDSILLLTFEDQPDGAKLHMVHTNISDEYAASIKKGWNEHYWNRWKKHLTK